MRVDSSGPSMEDLRTFLLLVELGSVGAVSRRLGIDSSVVSRRLRNLRDRYALLQKHGGSLVLTDRGRELLPTVTALLLEYERLNSTLNRKASARRTLTVAIGVFGAVHLIPETVAFFLRQHTDWEVNVRVCRGRERIMGVADGRFDLAVLSHSIEQIRSLVSGSQIVVEPLQVKPFVIIARPESSAGIILGTLPANAAVTIRDLSGVLLVGLDDAAGARTQLERQALGAGIKLQFGLAAGGWLAAREYARHGLGAALIPAEALRDIDCDELVVRIVCHSLCLGDIILHRPVDLRGIGLFRQVLAEKAAEHSRAQQRRLAHLKFSY
jgi:DNA-binding transcriptional LysR family regulator